MRGFTTCGSGIETQHMRCGLAWKLQRLTPQTSLTQRQVFILLSGTYVTLVADIHPLTHK